MTYPAWAEALVQAGLLTEANLEAATEVMEKAGIAEAQDDSRGFEEGLENAMRTCYSSLEIGR
jgi:hypothetical protein